MGLVKQKTIPTIVVFVNPFTRHDRADLALQIRLCLPHDDPASLNMEVEFIPGRVTDFNPGSEASNSPPANAISFANTMRTDGIPTAGTSITVFPERGGGSLRPFVTLDLANKQYRGALTCYHVVHPPYVASAEKLEIVNRYGSPPFLSHPTECDISFYAPRDAEATVQDLRNILHDASEEIKGAQEEKEGREISLARVARVPKGVTDIIRNLTTEIIPELEARLEVASKMPMKLGRTLASSGQTLSDNKLSDWALIDRGPKALGNSATYTRNIMPHIPPIYQSFNPANDLGLIEPRKEG
ncbi:uncharacterized protein BJX67DRAFT_262361 [Aspergillus lucknowensis]|uniref:Uncharacterized protein n=1 Tax=Aspergillus lucknowensis TaxID=176173 RepID=A0ABR4LFI0_9EURO